MLPLYHYPTDKKVLLQRRIPPLVSNKLIAKKSKKIVEQFLSGTDKQKLKRLLSSIKKYDGVTMNSNTLQVTTHEIERAIKKISPHHKKAIDTAIINIKAFHRQQNESQKSSNYQYKGLCGEILSQKVTPIEKVGIYVPGGTGGNTPLVSSLLMSAIPAIIAGCKSLTVVSPPKHDLSLDPNLAYALQTLGIKRAFKCGGAHAIGVLAYGCLPLIDKVDIVVGPGGPYVTAAKELVFGKVMVDGIFGPSEIVIISDGTVNASWLAADLLSQSEHAGNELCWLITTNKKEIAAVQVSLQQQLSTLPRKELCHRSLTKRGAIVLVKKLSDAFELTNQIAPEHLEMMTTNATKDSTHIKNAGAIFVGKYATEPIGDYICGTNHILPTDGSARFSSPLGVYTFQKRINVIDYNKQAFDKYHQNAAHLAAMEQLQAHQRALLIRTK